MRWNSEWTLTVLKSKQVPVQGVTDSFLVIKEENKWTAF